MHYLNKAATFVLISIATFLILIASTALWFEKDFYNKSRFTELTVEVFSIQEVREAVSNEIIIEVFSERPLLQILAADVVKPAITGLLDSNQLKSLVEEAAMAFHEVSIASEPQDVTLDISALKAILGLFSTLTESNLNVDEIPSKIVIIDAESIPDIHQIAFTFTWLGPLAGFVGLLILIITLYFSSDRFLQVERIGAVFVAGNVLYLLVVPYVGNILVAGVSGQYARTILNAFYNVFTADLVSILWVQLVIGAIIFATGFIVRRYGAPKLSKIAKE